ncbi:DUF4386 domain-containing protein [Aquabacterium sp.]|uniref:DUF4386 domain-containing protein n=1 Tax=Aquabacterium sp. TaxID=1872578 RepID=UPI002B930870|nr:DUF4386 domain-containing protein [Aquabacterium sp.]HSW04756.1 DUF4386 domain-containing protein [Aquabacterium sp.]
MKTPSRIEPLPRFHVRLGGVLYLAIIGLGLFGEMYVRGTLVVPGDAAATAGKLLQSQPLWRAGVAGDLLMQVLDLPVMLILYLLLRPVSRPLALLATLVNLVQTAVLALNKLSLLLPLLLLGDATYLKAFPAEQLQALAYLAIQLHGFGFGIGLIFFGAACLIRGYLIFVSGYLPRVLGLMMLAAGLSYLVNSFALLLAPAWAAALFPAVLVPAFVGELSLCLWMIAKGGSTPKPARLTAPGP